MGLNRAHQEVSSVATFIPGCWTLTVPDETWLYIRGWMQMVYSIVIWFILLKQTKQDGKILEYGDMEHYYYLHTNGNYSWYYVLCAQWVFFVTPDSLSSLPSCSMEVLLLPLLLNHSLSCSLPGGLGPPPFPLPGWPHFLQGPGTFPLLCWIH
jgi:hypothetical protein